MSWIDEAREKAKLKYEENVKNDPKQKHRLSVHECKACYYRTRIAGEAFTKFTCDICGKENMHHNTAVPKLCINCADKKVLCRRCMEARD